MSREAAGGGISRRYRQAVLRDLAIIRVASSLNSATRPTAGEACR
jgi:hypothetical protein